MLVPVALGVPAVLVLVPPPLAFSPAALAGFVQFAALVTCLAAVAAVFFDGLVEFMVGVDDPALASVEVFGMKRWSAEGEGKDCGQDGS
jgi:hypothetical protein